MPRCAFLVAEEARTAQDDELAGADDTGSSECKNVLGCVHIDWSGTANCGRKVPEVDAIFGKLSVKPEHSRRGIGKPLVASAERFSGRAEMSAGAGQRVRHGSLHREIAIAEMVSGSVLHAESANSFSHTRYFEGGISCHAPALDENNSLIFVCLDLVSKIGLTLMSCARAS